MKRPQLLVVIIVLFVGIVGYLSRVLIRESWETWRLPKLPIAAGYKAVGSNGASGTSITNTPIEPGYSTSENYVLETAPKLNTAGDPIAFKGELPSEVNLAVPFTTQAPASNWDFPYQEACEEASMIMVDAFYKGRTGRIPLDEADAEIIKLVDHEKTVIGTYEDTTADQTAKIIKSYYGYKRVIVKPLETIEDIKEPLALGYPVIVPAAGKLLNNPNFKNGGPPYHMLVVRGYTSSMFITNDPGTRKGEEYVYDFKTLMNAAHDWTGDKETVATGQPVMIVIIPN